jgi:SWIM zinc finger
VSQPIKDYIEAGELKPEQYIKSAAQAKGVQINDENTANRVESEMSRLLTLRIRHEVILRALIKFVTLHRDLQARARTVIENCIKANQLMLPFAHDSYKEQMDIVTSVHYELNFDGGAEHVLVKHQGKDVHQYTVNLFTGDCSCGMKAREGKGCRHVIAAYLQAGTKLKGEEGRRVAALTGEDRLRLMFHEQYFVDRYAKAYSVPPLKLPDLMTLVPTDTMEPAIVPKKMKGN